MSKTCYECKWYSKFSPKCPGKNGNYCAHQYFRTITPSLGCLFGDVGGTDNNELKEEENETK